MTSSVFSGYRWIHVSVGLLCFGFCYHTHRINPLNKIPRKRLIPYTCHILTVSHTLPLPATLSTCWLDKGPALTTLAPHPASAGPRRVAAWEAAASRGLAWERAAWEQSQTVTWEQGSRDGMAHSHDVLRPLPPATQLVFTSSTWIPIPSTSVLPRAPVCPSELTSDWLRKTAFW